MRKLLIVTFVFSILSKFALEPQSFLGLQEIQALLDQLDSDISVVSDETLVLMSVVEDFDDIKTGDELGIRAGGEPPLKTGEAPRNTIVASTKMRFKIPDMNA